MEMCVPSVVIFYIYICYLGLFQVDISLLFHGYSLKKTRKDIRKILWMQRLGGSVSLK